MNNILLGLFLILILQCIFMFFQKSTESAILRGGGNFINNIKVCRNLVNELF